MRLRHDRIRFYKLQNKLPSLGRYHINSDISLKKLYQMDYSDFMINSNSKGCLKKSSQYNPLVELGPSTICGGLGIIAQRDIPKGTPITAYPGAFIKKRKSIKYRLRKMVKQNEQTSSEYVLDTNNDYFIDGLKQGNHWWTKYGLGHMANDAICFELSGKTNNCDFKEVKVYIGKKIALSRNYNNKQYWRTRMILIASRSIKKGEELFVPYGLGYWLHVLDQPEDECRKKYGDDLYMWIQCQSFIQNMIQENLCPKSYLIEYRGHYNFKKTNDFFQNTFKYLLEVMDNTKLCCSSQLSEENLYKIDVTLRKSRHELPGPPGPHANVQCGVCNKLLFSKQFV